MKLFLLLTLALWATPACAQETPSLFFSADEEAEITGALSAQHHAHPERSTDRLTCDAILYTAPNLWKVWLSGKLYTPDTTHEVHSIEFVGADFVRLRLKDPKEGTRSVTLHPHQQYRFSTGDITEQH